jgi:peroxiredoxin (alkyl hydroperoxide reductase subunit C)
LIAFDNRVNEFEKRNVQVLGCSVDSHFSHLRWKEMEVNKGGIGKVKYPLISDLDKSIARSYDVLLGSTPATVLLKDDEIETTIGGGVTMRGSFLIDEEGVIRHAVLNDLPLGRNIDEMLRMVDALAFHTEHGDVCPANWQEGKKAMNPSDDGMRSYMAEEANNL